LKYGSQIMDEYHRE